MRCGASGSVSPGGWYSTPKRGLGFTIVRISDSKVYSLQVQTKLTFFGILLSHCSFPNENYLTLRLEQNLVCFASVYMFLVSRKIDWDFVGS